MPEAEALITAPEQDAPASLAEPIPTAIRLNGRPIAVTVDPRVTLLDLLRDRLDLTGTKKGCDHGQCGACTVLVDGTRMNSCLLLVASLDGAAITTIEGLGQPDALHPLQEAFIRCDALQCGYCTPGQICSAAGLMNEHPASSRDAVRERMSGNLCRCGAYPQIVDAVASVVLHRPRAEDAR